MATESAVSRIENTEELLTPMDVAKRLKMAGRPTPRGVAFALRRLGVLRIPISATQWRVSAAALDEAIRRHGAEPADRSNTARPPAASAST